MEDVMLVPLVEVDIALICVFFSMKPTEVCWKEMVSNLSSCAICSWSSRKSAWTVAVRSYIWDLTIAQPWWQGIIYSQDWIRTKTTILHLAYTVIRSYDIVSYRQHFVIMFHHQRSLQKDTDAAAHDRQGKKWPRNLLRSLWHFRLWGLWPYPVHQISREHTNVTRCCHGGSPPGHKCVSLRLLVSRRVLPVFLYEPDRKKIMIMAQLRTPGKYRRVHSDHSRNSADRFAHKINSIRFLYETKPTFLQ